VEAWPIPLAPCGRRGVVTSQVGPVWPPWGRGRSTGPRVAAVGAWPIPLALCGLCGGVASFRGPVRPP